MQTNQTPEELVEEVRSKVAEAFKAARYESLTQAVVLLAKAYESLNRLRDMAASGAKDAERVEWLEARRLKGITKGYKWDTWGYDTDRPIREQFDAAVQRGEE
jgi:hypothetical protein